MLWEPTDKLSVDYQDCAYGEVDAGSIVFNSIFHIPDFVPTLQAFGLPASQAAFGYENSQRP